MIMCPPHSQCCLVSILPEMPAINIARKPSWLNTKVMNNCDNLSYYYAQPNAASWCLITNTHFSSFTSVVCYSIVICSLKHCNEQQCRGHLRWCEIVNFLRKNLRSKTTKSTKCFPIQKWAVENRALWVRNLKILRKKWWQSISGQFLTIVVLCNDARHTDLDILHFQEDHKQSEMRQIEQILSHISQFEPIRRNSLWQEIAFCRSCSMLSL